MQGTAAMRDVRSAQEGANKFGNSAAGKQLAQDTQLGQCASQSH